MGLHRLCVCVFFFKFDRAKFKTILIKLKQSYRMRSA